jgi:hypothetical protein
MTAQHYSFRHVLAAAERINWRIEDLIGGQKRLGFDRPFLPETLARTQPLAFLSAPEQRVLNQIRGHAYLCIFGLVEEFILPFVLDHVRPRLQGDHFETRAFLQFAAEEAKHIQLFKRFRAAFECGFGRPCDVIGPPEAIAQAVLAHHPLSIALVVLHIEWMTQRHYRDSARDDDTLDPTFKSLLLHHWMEEAQHAKLDTLLVHALADGLGGVELDKAVQGYLEIGSFLDGGLKQQVEFDLAALEQAIGRSLAAKEQAEFRAVQHRANRWTYLGSGMTHRNFTATLSAVHPCGAGHVAAVARLFC